MIEKGMLKFTHDIQVGHRLFLQEGKCQKIHGHSMTVMLSLNVNFDLDGYAINDEGSQLEFGAVKKQFRQYLDEFYDHHLLLNENDPWAGSLFAENEGSQFETLGTLPGLRKVPGDPSTEVQRTSRAGLLNGVRRSFAALPSLKSKRPTPTL
jgi:6-pyruvoyl-tetrahydropterin synthase